MSVSKGKYIQPQAGGTNIVLSTAKLMKTNQLTSFRTGDDGDFEDGRLTDFFTLIEDNPFGNTTRFTDELGTQTYTNGIMLDWSTYDGATVLGYTENIVGVWNGAVDFALTISPGGFTGWHLTNSNELWNLVNENTTRNLEWSPLSIIAPFVTSNLFWWTSTTPANNTGRAKAFLNQVGVVGNEMSTFGKALGGVRSIAAREFTNAELGVTPNVPVQTLSSELNQTGQVVSYRTNDDGDLEKGKNVDWDTLNNNNPFGDTNRFTDELGDQTYTNDIVIDWSTYDSLNGKVTGYYRLELALAIWNDQIDNCAAHSVGTFTSGWRLLNKNEMVNIQSERIGDGFINWSPLNISTAGNFSTSTTKPNTTANAYHMNTGTSGISNAAKTITMFGIPVRTFTVAGTTLT